MRSEHLNAQIEQLEGRLRTQILEAVRASHLSQRQIADMLGVDRVTVNRRLNGNFTLRGIAELAIALNLDLDLRFISSDKAIDEMDETYIGSISSGADTIVAR